MKKPDSIEKKIRTRSEIPTLFTESFRKEHTLVFTNGCFDILHQGHLHLLHAARALGDILVVGLNTDSSVRLLKGEGRPVTDEATRAALLAAMTVVDFVFLFNEETPLELIRTLKPDVLVKGGDYKTHEIVGHDEVVARGGKVITIPLLEGFSSSALIDKMGK